MGPERTITWSMIRGPWLHYDECGLCGAWPTEPCFDKRKKLRDVMTGKQLYIQRPHKGRARAMRDS